MIARKPQTAAPIQALFPAAMPAPKSLTERLSTWQNTAKLLHDKGLNVIPLGSEGESRKLPRGMFQWEKVGLTRSPMRLVDSDDGMALLLSSFDGACNVGIVCGAVSENLFAIDCETMPIFWRFVQAMKERNIPVFAQKTGRGAHILLKADKPVQSFKIIGKEGVTLYEVRSNGQYIVSAPSYHPSGVRYMWMNAEGALSAELPFLPEIPRVTIEQIDFLIEADGKPKALQAIRATSAASKRRRQYMSKGQNTPEGNRETELFQQASYSRFIGIPRNQAEAELVHIAIESGLGAKEAYHAIDMAYSYPQKAQQQEVAGMVDKLLAFHKSHKWANKADMRVFEAMITRYAQDNFNYGKSRSFSASSRNLSELTALHRKTVEKAIKRLIHAEGLITKQGENSHKASVYRFTDRAICCIAFPLEAKLLKDNHTGSLMQQNSIEKDLKERNGIGDTGLRILRFLQAEYRQHGKPSSAAKIAQVIGIDRSTVYRHLAPDNQGNVPPLLEYKLVMRHGKGWVAFEDSAAERDLAQALGVIGKSQERKEKHALERSLAIVKAMHKQIVERDTNHPLHHTTKTASASDMLEAYSQEIAKKGQNHE